MGGAVQFAPFVGRRRELATLRTMVASGHRLITVTGVAGIGKSRLLRELVLEREQSTELLCDLADARRAHDLEAVVADALGVRDHIPRALAARGSCLLALDNFDDLEPAATSVLSGWLDGAPRACVVLTSRRVLGIGSEVTFDVTPLPTDGAHGDANTLWEDRVRQVRPGYRIADDDRPAVEEIVRLLEGIPLGIELAAPRMRVAGSRDLLAMLRRDLSALGPSRTHPPRHRSLQTALGGSWNALDGPEQEALGRCAVFAGGFTLDAAQAVIAADATLEILQSLREHSLVREHPSSTPRAVRLSLYRAVKQFVLTRVDQDVLAAAQELHAEHYLRAAEEWAYQLQTTGDMGWMTHMRLEQQNLFAVSARGPLERSLRTLVVVHLLPFHASRRSGDELTEALRRAEPVAASLPAETLGIAHLQHAYYRYEAGDPDGADASLARALEIVARTDSLRLRVMAASYEGAIQSRRQRRDETEEAYARVVELSRGTPYERVGQIAEVRRMLNRLQRGHDVTDIGRVVGIAQSARESGDANLLLNALECASAHFVSRGRHAQGARTVDELYALSMTLRSSRVPWRARVLGGHLALDQGRSEEAEAAYRHARRLSRVLGDRRPEAWCTRALALAQWQGLKVEEALVSVRAARRHDPAARALERAIGWDAGGSGPDPSTDDPAPLRAFAEVARARRSLETADRRTARTIAERLCGSPFDPADLCPPLHAVEARAVCRILTERVDALVRELRASAPDALQVDDAGGWVRTRAGERRELSTKPVLRGLLQLLARRAQTNPGEPVPIDELLEAGWPGQRMRPASARRRLEVSISRLRKLGLGDELGRAPEGYRLGAGCVIVQSSTKDGGRGGTRK